MFIVKQIFRAIVAVFVAAEASNESCAQTIDSELQVLGFIGGAAGQICASAISDSTDKSGNEVLRRLVEQLADLGLNIQSRGSGEVYADALQTGLPKNLRDNPDCKLQAMDILVDALLHDEAVGAEVLLAIKCDQLASHPSDKARPVGIPGVDLAHIDSVRAVAACRAALHVRPNDIRLIYQLGRGLQKDGSPAALVEAARLYKLGAEQGYAPAQTNLGILYGSGLGGLSKDEQEAARHYKLAADQGYAPAQYDLGRFYERGRGGLSRDEQEAARLYKLAADQGHAAAQDSLGHFYESGSGRGEIKKDDHEAARLYKLAADQGLAAAQFNLGRFYEKGRGGLAPNDGEAARLYRLAADQGYAAAQFSLGRFFESGRGGLAQDNQEAVRLYDLAADQGYAGYMGAGEPMRIVAVRSAQPGCEPNCAEWLSAEGSIGWATAEQLRKVVNSLNGKKLPILIHSAGGVTYPAELMGYFIRSHGLDVAVGRTVFEPCTNAPGGCKQAKWSGPLGEPSLKRASCYSACSFVLAGGIRRFVGPEARVGIHNFLYNTPTVEKWRQTYRGKMPIDSIIERSFAPPAVAHARTYFRKLGIAEELEELAIATPVTDIRILTETELLRTRLATEIKSGHDVVYP